MSCSTELSSGISIGSVDVFVLGFELLLLSVGVEGFGFLEGLSEVSVSKLYNNALFSEADDDDGVGDGKDDDVVVLEYGVVPDIYSKLCSLMYNLFSYMSSPPTIETFDPNLAFFVQS